MSILFTICARAGSKGLKNKNIKIFNGAPLVNYTLASYDLFCREYGHEYGDIDLAINTDSVELIAQADAIGIPYIHIPRKPELAGDTVGKVPVIRDTVIELEKIIQKRYDFVVDLDVTSPIRRSRDIAGVLGKLSKSENPRFKEDFDVAFSAVSARRLPFFNMVIEESDGSCKLIVESEYVSRQQAPKCYDLNASIYAYTREFLVEKMPGKVLDGKATVYEMPDTGILDIDSEEDFELMQVIMEYLSKRDKELMDIIACALKGGDCNAIL